MTLFRSGKGLSVDQIVFKSAQAEPCTFFVGVGDAAAAPF